MPLPTVPRAQPCWKQRVVVQWLRVLPGGADWSLPPALPESQDGSAHGARSDPAFAPPFVPIGARARR